MERRKKKWILTSLEGGEWNTGKTQIALLALKMGNGKNGFLPALNLENGNKMEIKWILTTLEKWKKH